MEWQEDKENCAVRNLTVCFFRQILLEWSSEENASGYVARAGQVMNA
jgi:hypothetical protein